MVEMRQWLNRHGVQPECFEHSVGGPGVTYRVHFTADRDAVAFAEQFHGRLSGGADPHGPFCWNIQARPAQGDEVANGSASGGLTQIKDFEARSFRIPLPVMHERT